MGLVVETDINLHGIGPCDIYDFHYCSWSHLQSSVCLAFSKAALNEASIDDFSVFYKNGG